MKVVIFIALQLAISLAAGRKLLPGCVSLCPVYVQAQLVCASNGKLYVDECQAKCKDPSLTQLFACDLPLTDQSTADCKKMCSLSTCLNKCPVYFAAQSICASNGNLYTDECQAKCYDQSLVKLFTCDIPLTDENKSTCQKKCSEVISCQTACPVYIKKQSVCASDGKLYVDECRAKCADLSLYQLFACGQLSDDLCLKKCKQQSAVHS
jgi:hypothetical protein